MAVEVVTRKDLQLFCQQLLESLRQLLAPFQNKEEKRWQNCEVRMLLQASAHTVQRLRMSWKFGSSRTSGAHYYEDSQNLKKSCL